MPRKYTDKERRKYWAQKNALTQEEKDFIEYYNLQWVMRHRVPSIEEVAQFCKIPQTTANFYLSKNNIQKALQNRGIPWQQHSREMLTHQQIACAIVMMNFADTRSNATKLDQLGVNPTQYQAWLQDPNFKNLITNLSEQNLSNIKETAVGELTKKIYAGDWQAVRFYLETTGTIERNDAPQSEQIMRFLLEIIQEEVKDPATMIRIANRIKLATQNRTLEIPETVDGTYTVDELEDAKKRIGFG